jgi:hypothetical protein
LSEAPLRVLGPNETLDLHRQSLCGGGRLGTRNLWSDEEG